MKIILSPSKTQDFTRNMNRKITTPFYDKRAGELADKIRLMSTEQLARAMNIKDQILEDTYEGYQRFGEAKRNPAIYTYTGLVYKYMNISGYNDSMLAYLEEHLRILSALYGVLSPFDGIKPYRLDMKSTIMRESLYSYWKEPIQQYFQEEEILNLASEEFAKMISLPMKTVGFRDYKDEKYKNLATYAKMARGMLLDYMVKHQIKEIDELKSISFEQYHYNEGLSDDNIIMFTRNANDI